MTIVTLRACSKQFWAVQVSISSDMRVNTPHKRVGNNVLVRYPFSPVSKSRGAPTFSAQANLHSATHSSARPPRNQATLLCRQIDIRSTVRTTSLEVASFERCLMIHGGCVSAFHEADPCEAFCSLHDFSHFFLSAKLPLSPPFHPCSWLRDFARCQ